MRIVLLTCAVFLALSAEASGEECEGLETLFYELEQSNWESYKLESKSPRRTWKRWVSRFELPGAYNCEVSEKPKKSGKRIKYSCSWRVSSSKVQDFYDAMFKSVYQCTGDDWKWTSHTGTFRTNFHYALKQNFQISLTSTESKSRLLDDEIKFEMSVIQ